jgi:hypothetical protein
MIKTTAPFGWISMMFNNISHLCKFAKMLKPMRFLQFVFLSKLTALLSLKSQKERLLHLEFPKSTKDCS